MKQVRLYERPQEFAEMMVGHLSGSLGTQVRLREDEPLLLEFCMDSGQKEKTVISLHDPYHTYMAGGDLNTAVDYLNQVIRTSNFIHSNKDYGYLDANYIFPALRDERYVEGVSRDSAILSDAHLPGLRVVYLEIKDGVTKIISEALLEHNPKLKEEHIRKLAYANLKAAGWQQPQMSLTVPFRKSCTVEVFMDHPHPIEGQFFLKEWKRHMPSSFAIAFTNRMNMMMMHSTERIDSVERAKQLIDKTRFREMVKRSYYLMPSPVSQNIYWVHNGEARLL